MKSGTTTLFRWLAEQPEVTGATSKEPAFFSRDDRWELGLSWYEALFEATAVTQWLIEASTSYTNPDYSAKAARRMAEVRPTARLVYLLREPIDRARSHYRHQVQRGRERRPLIPALSDPGTNYLAQSRYWSCLVPYTEVFDRHQILVLRFEDLIGDEGVAWERVLRFLDMDTRPRPELAHNVTAAKPAYAGLLGAVARHDRLLRLATSLPGPVRKVAGRLIDRRPAGYESLMAGSTQPLPSSLTEDVWDDVAQLELWLGSDGPLWRRPEIDS